jgi:microcystin-dependent protein
MDPYLGQIQAFAFSYAPAGWVMCNGQLLSVQEYPALFSLLGVAYGGDGRTTFGVPDLRGRVPMGWTNGSVSGITSNNMGNKKGAEYTYLTQKQLPAHTHAASASGTGALSGSITAVMNVNNTGGNEITPDGNYLSTDVVTTFYAQGAENGKTLASGAITVNNGLSLDMSNIDVEISATPAQTDELYLFQPSQVVNYCISIEGGYPPRS